MDRLIEVNKYLKECTLEEKEKIDDYISFCKRVVYNLKDFCLMDYRAMFALCDSKEEKDEIIKQEIKKTKKKLSKIHHSEKSLQGVYTRELKGFYADVQSKSYKDEKEKSLYYNKKGGELEDFYYYLSLYKVMGGDMFNPLFDLVDFQNSNCYDFAENINNIKHKKGGMISIVKNVILIKHYVDRVSYLSDWGKNVILNSNRLSYFGDWGKIETNSKPLPPKGKTETNAKPLQTQHRRETSFKWTGREKELKELMRLMIKGNWIDKETNLKDFKAIFTEQPLESIQPIKWGSNIGAEVLYFFKELKGKFVTSERMNYKKMNKCIIKQNGKEYNINSWKAISTTIEIDFSKEKKSK